MRLRKIAMHGDVDGLHALIRNPETMIAAQARRLMHGLTRGGGGARVEKQTPRLELARRRVQCCAGAS